MIKKIFVIFVLLSISCSGRPTRLHPNNLDSSNKFESSIIATKADKAPWEVWTVGKFANKDFLTALRFEEEGNLSSAAEYFTLATEGAKSSEEAETYLLLHSSVQLKQGEPDKALGRISKYAEKRKLDPAQLDPRFSLLTAYCYIAKNNLDQSYAWLVQAYKGSRGVGSISDEVKRVAKEHVRTLDKNELDALSAKWEKDNFVSSLVRDENTRRMQGGSLLSRTYFAKYFDANSYELNGDFVEVPSSTNITASANEASPPTTARDASMPFKLGALLPLTGQYASHAKKVEEGIRLALRENNLEDKLIVLDSSADINILYDKLAEEGARLVYGPMLVKDVESLATVAPGGLSRLSIPLITYAKKRGIPGLSEKIFRIGGTAENQLQTLLIFADTKIGAHKIALLYPDGEVGQEYNDALQVIRSRGTTGTVETISYQGRNLTQIESLKERLKSEAFDTVIIADALPSAEPLLRSLKELQAISSLNILGVSLLAETDKLNHYPELVEGMYVVSLFNLYSRKPEVVKFRDEYKKAFGRDPDLLSAQSYDSVKFSLAPIENTSGNIVESLSQSSKVQGVTGTMHVLADGDINRDLPILKVVSGSLFELTE